MKQKYGYLLSDGRVRRWFENVQRGSKASAAIYLRALGNFCKRNNITPIGLTELKDRELYDLLLDYVSSMEKSGAAGSYAASVLKVVKSWLAFNRVEVRGKIRIRGAHETPTLDDERIPSQEELKQILLSGDEKGRVACVLLAHCGLRPEVLGNFDGTDGLRIKDVPDLELERNEVYFTQMPAMVRVRSALSKKGHEYFTFLSEEGCQYLKGYLDLRMRAGERLSGESAVVTPKTARKSFITTVNIGDIVRKAIRKAGHPWRPYVLRSYFATQMMLAESKGLIIRDYRTFFMGHKGDIEAVYTLNKKRLPPDVVEQMRDGYTKAQRFLRTAAPFEKEDVTRAFKRQLLLVAGFKPEEIKDEHLELADEEFQTLVRDRLVSAVKNNGARQKVVRTSDVEAHLRDGWEFVSALPDGKAVLKLPHLD